MNKSTKIVPYVPFWKGRLKILDSKRQMKGFKFKDLRYIVSEESDPDIAKIGDSYYMVTLGHTTCGKLQIRLPGFCLINAQSH